MNINTSEPVHDVFVSYAHADDTPPLQLSHGWVTTLITELKKNLLTKLGWEPDVYVDHRLAAGEDFGVLLDKVRSSRTLLLLMSPAYQQSEWCRRELGGFLSTAQTERIFIVETAPIRRSEWHPALRELKSIAFWRRQRSWDPPELLGFPQPDLLEKPWWQRVNELAHLLADHLRSRSSAPRIPIWLAETTEDLADERERVAAALRQHGYDPLPAIPYPLRTRTAYDEALQRDLQRVVALVQLFGRSGGHLPEWSATRTVVLQAQAAHAIEPIRGIRYFRWRTPSVTLQGVTDHGYRDIITGVETSAVEEFIDRLLRALASSKLNPHAAAHERRFDGPSTPLIVVKADVVDRDLADLVQESLARLGVDVAMAPEPQPGQTPEQIRREQETQLHACDGVVLIYGRTPAAWVQSQFALTRRVLAPKHRGVWGALVDGPPDPKPDAGLRSSSLLLLECRRGVDAGKLQTFVLSLQP